MMINHTFEEVFGNETWIIIEVGGPSFPSAYD